MTDTSSDAFLSGRGIPVDPHDIETELTRLWGPAAERVGGPSLESPNVTRIVLANLVFASRMDDAPRLEGVLDTVTARYPCRGIVILRTDDPDRRVSAEVSALCHLPAPGLPQVCSERIVLRAGPRAVDLLPGAVRPLLETDLPFVLWWTYDPRLDEALFRDLAGECSRLILDLPDPGTDPAALRLGLDPEINVYSRDPAWFGLARWREMIAQFFDPPCPVETPAQIDSVSIRAVSPAGDAPPRRAVWLAAWLAGQLGWQPQGHPDRVGNRLAATFLGPSGPIAVEIVTEADPAALAPRLNGATLTARGPDGVATFRLDRPSSHSSEVDVEVVSPMSCSLPRSFLAPELDSSRRLAYALESARDDPPFGQARPHALWLLSQGR